MPTGKYLNKFEKRKIIAIGREQIPMRSIAEALRRNAEIVQNFLMKRTRRCRTETPKNAKKISGCDRRLIFRLPGESSALQIKAALIFWLQSAVCRSSSQARNISGTEEWIEFQQWPVSIKKKATVSSTVYLGRRNFVDPRYVFWWEKLKFGGLDGLEMYWNDLRKEPYRFQNRQNGGDLSWFGPQSFFMERHRWFSVQIRRTLTSTVRI